MHLLAVILPALLFVALRPLPVLAGGDAAKGEGIFTNRCSDCHMVRGDTVKKAPPLTGLFGRVSGTWAGFDYSDAMKSAAIVWDEDTLTQFLKNPRGYVPKTKMPFNGLKRAGEAEDLIAYLRDATAD